MCHLSLYLYFYTTETGRHRNNRRCRQPYCNIRIFTIQMVFHCADFNAFMRRRMYCGISDYKQEINETHRFLSLCVFLIQKAVPLKKRTALYFIQNYSTPLSTTGGAGGSVTTGGAGGSVTTGGGACVGGSVTTGGCVAGASVTCACVV